MFDQVNVAEDPAFADLGAWDLAGTCLLLQRDRMDMQERGSGLQIEGIHARMRQPLSTQIHRGNLLSTVSQLTVNRRSRLPINGLLLRRQLLRRGTAVRGTLPAS